MIPTITMGMDWAYPLRIVKQSPIISIISDNVSESFLPARSVKVEKMSIPPIDPTKTNVEKRVIIAEDSHSKSRVNYWAKERNGALEENWSLSAY